LQGIINMNMELNPIKQDTMFKNDNPWGNSQPNNNKNVKNDNEHLKNFNLFPEIPHNKNFLFGILAALITVWLLSGFYQVQEGEESLIVRFGKYVRTEHTGLNYHLPYPIESTIIEKVGLIRKEDLGTKTGTVTKLTKKSPATNSRSSANQVLTGDENILDISYVVQWKINNLYNFAFKVADPRQTIREVTESTLREIVGRNTLAKSYTDGRFEVEKQARELAQETIDRYELGVELVAIQMMKVDPPAEVIDSFREVQNAKADKEREINLAQSYRNDVIPKARGEVAKLTHDASAYKEEVVSKAEGDAARFKMVLNEYKKAKDITKKRIYLDTMQHILKDTETVILGDTQNNISYLPLPTLNKQKEN
jgi:modulator of FtsH protease HflK